MCVFSRAVGRVVSSAERRVPGRMVKKLGANLEYLACSWAVLHAQCLGCAVWLDRGWQWAWARQRCPTACWWQLCYWGSRDIQGISPRANGASALVALHASCEHPSCPSFPRENQGMGELYPPATLCLYRSPQMPLNLTILGARKYNVTEKASPTEM